MLYCGDELIAAHLCCWGGVTIGSPHLFSGHASTRPALLTEIMKRSERFGIQGDRLGEGQRSQRGFANESNELAKTVMAPGLRGSVPAAAAVGVAASGANSA